MNNYIIVGAGLSGLLAGRILKSTGKSFTILEKEDRVGGRTETGHHRILSEKSIDYLRHWCPIEWLRVDALPVERKKGEWANPEPSEESRENFYLGSNFYQPRTSFSDVIRQLGEPLSEHIAFRKTVEKIDSENKKVICVDGTEYLYEKLLWCTHLSLLRKLWSGNDSELTKSLKKLPVPQPGLNIDFTLKSPLFSFENSVVFPFRFKDEKFRAVGIQEHHRTEKETAEQNLHWIIFLAEDIAEDREEVAKIIRSFKRELQKEFPVFAETIKHEKITFLPAISGEEPVPLKSLEISPNVFYLGPQVRLKDEPEEANSLLNIDRTLQNCIAFQDAFAN